MLAVNDMRVIGGFRSPICRSERRQQLQYVIECRLADNTTQVRYCLLLSNASLAWPASELLRKEALSSCVMSRRATRVSEPSRAYSRQADNQLPT